MGMRAEEHLAEAKDLGAELAFQIDQAVSRRKVRMPVLKFALAGLYHGGIAIGEAQEALRNEQLMLSINLCTRAKRKFDAVLKRFE